MREYQHSHDYHVALLNDLKFLGNAQAEPIRDQQRQIVGHLVRAIERARPGALSARSRKPLAMALLGSLNFTFAWLRPDGEIGPDEYADRVVDIWLGGLSGRRPAPAN